MKKPRLLFLTIFFCGIGLLHAGDTGSAAIPKLLIEPSSTKTSLANCELTVGALECREQALNGSYAIKVTPFTFKNDHGSLVLAMSDESALKMSKGESVEFSGMAISARDGKKKPIKGRTKPQAADHGGVSFVVSTEDGDLLFTSTYKIVAK